MVVRQPAEGDEVHVDQLWGRPVAPDRTVEPRLRLHTRRRAGGRREGEEALVRERRREGLALLEDLDELGGGQRVHLAPDVGADAARVEQQRQHLVLRLLQCHEQRGLARPRGQVRIGTGLEELGDDLNIARPRRVEQGAAALVSQPVHERPPLQEQPHGLNKPRLARERKRSLTIAVPHLEASVGRQE